MKEDHRTTSSLRAWPALARSLQRVRCSPLTLYCVLLLLNALARPYLGIVHDARFYAVQVLNRLEPQRYGADLYLKFGSQDNYSLFSDLVSPFADWFGLTTAFFLVYLLCVALFFAALQRFVEALIQDRVASTVALVYLAVNPIPFAGLGIFHVNESFLTPRLLAIALVLFGLQRLIRGSSVISLGWMLAALLIHPLMALSGLGVWVFWQLRMRCSARTLTALVVSGAVVLAVVLAYAPLAIQLFGLMDDSWRQSAMQANPYSVPAHWDWSDWIRLALAASVVVVSRVSAVHDANVRRLLDAVLVVALVGAIVGLAAPYLPYALLFQGQAYRAVWILQLASIPLLFALTCHTVQRPSYFLGILNVLLLTGFAAVSMTEWQFLAAVVFLTAVWSWQCANRGLVRGTTAAFRIGAAIGIAVALVPTLISAFWVCRVLAEHCGPHRYLLTIPQTIGPLFTCLLALCGLTLLSYGVDSNRRFRAVALIVSLAAQIGFYWIPMTPLAEAGIGQTARDVAFVKSFLKQDDRFLAEGTTLYWPLAPLEEVWVTLQSRSYYSLPQMSGNMFYRDTAIEGQRRATVSGKFEMVARQELLPLMTEHQRRVLRDVFSCDDVANQLTWEDVRLLCREQDLDLLVLRHAFEGRYVAGNGHVYLYDCGAIRTAENSLPVSRQTHQPSH